MDNENKKQNEFEEINDEKIKNDNFSCPNCDAQIIFNPAKSSLECSYCGYVEKVIGFSSDEENDLDEAEEHDESWIAETKIVRCENCDAENVISTHQIATECPFCGSSQVVLVDELVGKKPDRVISFKISEDDSREAFKRWVKGKFYIPRKVKKNIPSIKVRGVYLPAWTYDSETISPYEGRLGKHYTVTVGSGKNRRTEVRTKWFRISGVERVNFDDVLINAGGKVTGSELSSIEPFNTNESFVYEEKFLAGFSAEHYKVNVHQGFKEAKKEMSLLIRSKILSHYHYDVVGYLNYQTSYDNNTYKYVLLPIWIGAYEHNKKNYRFITNGETGKITGKYPISAVKVTFTVLFIILIIAAFIYFYLYA